MKLLAALVLWAVVAFNAASATVISYPIPAGVEQNHDFSVKVRSPGGDWQPIEIYRVGVDMRSVKQASLAMFDFSGRVEVAIVYNRGPVESARIRPASLGLSPTVLGNAVTFSLAKPCDLSLEINGDIYHNLHLFTNPPEGEAPRPDDPNVIYLGPGLHTPPTLPLPVLLERVVNGHQESATIRVPALEIPSGKTLYLAGGCVLNGAVLCKNVENVRIRGRGVLLQGREGFDLLHSKKIEIDDITVIDSQHYAVFGGNVDGLTIRNLRAFSCVGNGDGIDLMCCSNVMVDGGFLRNSDDTIALYNHRWDFFGDTKNVVVKNISLWADVAHPIQIGVHGYPPSPEELVNLTFANIDILEHNEKQLGYQGCMSINVSDANLAKDIRFEDIRIDDFTEGQLVNLRVAFNRKYTSAPGRGIENVTFKNITYTGTHANMSIIAGYDDSRLIDHVTFENLVINGQEISWRMKKPAWYPVWDLGKIFVGEHVADLVFLPPGGAKPAPRQK